LPTSCWGPIVVRSTDVHLCFDLGGTKLKGAFVNSRGRILAAAVRSVRQEEGYDGLIELFREVRADLPAKQKFASVAVASAGPLHSEKGLLLDPTNFFTDQRSWGVLPLVKSLKRVFRVPVYLENDAAAAVLGERWRGGHGRIQNILAMTLGTGVGIGVIANGDLVRAGRGLHPEASHIPINAEDRTHPCGCGAYGCIEAYVAGSHFSRRLSRQKGSPLSGLEAVALARSGDVQTQEAFREYGRHLAQAIRSLSVVFAPEVVVLSGGFSHAADLFLSETLAVLPSLMERYREGIDLLPKIKVSKLQDDAGVLGAAYLAFQK
jgi:glucokinase